MSTSTTPARRTGGRSAAFVASVKRATEDLIRENGRERVSIPMVAERAGVNATSIYRRWGDLPSMVNDLATYRLDPDRALPDTGDLRRDLVDWAAEIVRHYQDPVKAAILRGGAAVAGDVETDCMRNRRAEAGILLTAAAARLGTEADAPMTIDDILDAVIGPLVYRVIFVPDSLDDELAERLVDRLFAGR